MICMPESNKCFYADNLLYQGNAAAWAKNKEHMSWLSNDWHERYNPTKPNKREQHLNIVTQYNQKYITSQ